MRERERKRERGRESEREGERARERERKTERSFPKFSRQSASKDGGQFFFPEDLH